MVSLQNIQSLTDFRHNAKKYVEQLQETQSPLVLTVNGKAAVVVKAAEAYEAYQARIRELEAEVNALNSACLHRPLGRLLATAQCASPYDR